MKKSYGLRFFTLFLFGFLIFSIFQFNVTPVKATATYYVNDPTFAGSWSDTGQITLKVTQATDQAYTEYWYGPIPDDHMVWTNYWRSPGYSLEINFSITTPIVNATSTGDTDNQGGCFGRIGQDPSIRLRKMSGGHPEAGKYLVTWGYWGPTQFLFLNNFTTLSEGLGNWHLIKMTQYNGTAKFYIDENLIDTKSADNGTLAHPKNARLYVWECSTGEVVIDYVKEVMPSPYGTVTLYYNFDTFRIHSYMMNVGWQLNNINLGEITHPNWSCDWERYFWFAGPMYYPKDEWQDDDKLWFGTNGLLDYNGNGHGTMDGYDYHKAEYFSSVGTAFSLDNRFNNGLGFCEWAAPGCWQGKIPHSTTTVGDPIHLWIPYPVPSNEYFLEYSMIRHMDPYAHAPPANYDASPYQAMASCGIDIWYDLEPDATDGSGDTWWDYYNGMTDHQVISMDLFGTRWEYHGMPSLGNNPDLWNQVVGGIVNNFIYDSTKYGSTDVNYVSTHATCPEIGVEYEFTIDLAPYINTVIDWIIEAYYSGGDPTRMPLFGQTEPTGVYLECIAPVLEAIGCDFSASVTKCQIRKGHEGSVGDTNLTIELKNKNDGEKLLAHAPIHLDGGLLAISSDDEYVVAYEEIVTNSTWHKLSFPKKYSSCLGLILVHSTYYSNSYTSGISLTLLVDGSIHIDFWTKLVTDVTITIYFEVERSEREIGGWCPTLFVWNGSGYNEETFLDIHSQSDVTIKYLLKTKPVPIEGSYKLQLRELDTFTSHIDSVNLLCGQKNCELKHATKGECTVTELLKWDDDKRVDLEPNDIITLIFDCDGSGKLIFVINGYNAKIPMVGSDYALWRVGYDYSLQTTNVTNVKWFDYGKITAGSNGTIALDFFAYTGEFWINCRNIETIDMQVGTMFADVELPLNKLVRHNNKITIHATHIENGSTTLIMRGILPEVQNITIKYIYFFQETEYPEQFWDYDSATHTLTIVLLPCDPDIIITFPDALPESVQSVWPILPILLLIAMGISFLKYRQDPKDVRGIAEVAVGFLIFVLIVSLAISIYYGTV